MTEKNQDLPDRPFRLGTTSFIYPDHIIPNVRKIGGFFDEIELLVFESIANGVLPSKSDIRELGLLANELDLTYNIHLPTDISLTDPSQTQRALAADTLVRVIELFAPLTPTTYTLHLPRTRKIIPKEDLLYWEERARKGLSLLVPRLDDPRLISLETLWYQPEPLKPLIDDFNLSLCLDAGHHFKYDYDLKTTFDLFGKDISLVHLHGVDFSGQGPRDHTGLDRLPHDLFDLTTRLLATYEGTVCLEVFNLENLTRSLVRLAGVFNKIPQLEL
jgi:sugar phosphate isomerase/epimerase